MNEMRLSGAIILNDDKELLLIHRNTYDKVEWELPGGKIEIGEIPEITAARELKEELNVDIIVDNNIGIAIFESNNYLMRYYWYKSYIISGLLRLNENKFDKYNYFNQDLLLKMDDLSPNVKLLSRNIDFKRI